MTDDSITTTSVFNNHLVRKQQSLNMQAVGQKCKLHRNDNLAWQIEQGRHLILLHDNSGIHNHHEDVDMDYVTSNVYEYQERFILGGIQCSSSHNNDADSTIDPTDSDNYQCGDQNNNNGGGDVNAGIEIIRPPLAKHDNPSSSMRREQVIMMNEPVYVDRYDVRVLLSDESYYLLMRPDDHCNIYSSQIRLHDYDYSWDDDLSNEQGRILNEERFGDLMMMTVNNQNRYVEMDDRIPSESLLYDDQSNSQCDMLYKPRPRSPILQPNSKTLEVYCPSKEDESKIPKGMILPKTKRMYQIMKITATKSNESLQFEIFLKAKEHDNVDFKFLKVDHELHPFYQWLKDPRPKQQSDHCQNSQSPPDESTTFMVEPHTCKSSNEQQSMKLLEMYATSSSDDDDDESQAIDGNNVKESCSGATPVTSTDISKRGKTSRTEELEPMDDKRLKRLKRAKMLREHFANR